MALQLIRSNRVENLFSLLGQQLSNEPLFHPLATEIIVVGNPAMARWLNLQLARTLGIAANIDYPLPASFVWRCTRQLLDHVPEQDPLSRDMLGWKIYALLPALSRHAAFKPLQPHLAEDVSGLKRWQLAIRIADVFDRYQYYRPDLIRQWSKGVLPDHSGQWQVLLWQALVEGNPHQHRVAIFDRLLQLLRSHNPITGLPERIGLFSLAALPPILLQIIRQLALHTTVNWFQLSPTEHYWADLKSHKSVARSRLAEPVLAEYLDTGNELLASWGRQGQVLQELLLEEGPVAISDHDHFAEPEATTLLERLQGHIFSLGNSSHPSQQPRDSSLTVHCCHSPWRECQVLHDELLRMLAADETLQPEDILVMVPDISSYAPYIEAEFGHHESNVSPFIPWNLSDICMLDEHPLLQTFLQLLDLPNSRFSILQVLGLLQIPALAQRFALTTEDCLLLKSLFSEARVHWGIDATHKTALDLPPTYENTWQQAQQRLLAAYAMGDCELWNDIAPLSPVDRNQALVLGRFWLFFEKLLDYRKILTQHRDGSTWQPLLNRLLADFFHEPADTDGRLQQLRDVIDKLRQQAEATVLSLQVLQYWLQQQLQHQISRSHYFSGGITFCGMQPMRSMPFKVICLLGLNDGNFPRRDKTTEFDLMAQQWQPGDPRHRDADRYLLLEVLLCVRQHLYISYTGRDLHDNKERQPSVLVTELLDFLSQDQQQAAAANRPGLPFPVIQHPMQPFSPTCYQGEQPGFPGYWFELAKALQPQPAPAPFMHWPDTILPVAEEQALTPDWQQLLLFVVHPVRFFCNQRLQIYLHEQVASEEMESFTLDGLTAWELKRTMVEAQLLGRKTRLELAKARGLLPHGALSAYSFNTLKEDLQPFFEQLDEFSGKAWRSMEVHLILDPQCHLQGRIEQYLPGQGILFCQPSRFKCRPLLQAWLSHLLACAAGRLADGETSTLVCSDRSLRFPRIEIQQSAALLRSYLQLYRQGIQRPLLLLPGASLAWAQQANDPDKALLEARAKWLGIPFKDIPGDRDDPYIQLMLHDTSGDPLLADSFTTLATNFFTAALKYGAAP
ncbi:MAG TPA: exodeoxyribonuclease V subunit gamma [Gammaproteobacteria bacterium]|nr:exodeoxyribonuclease V subunit gamma [Gammaproteobacteria bacterium]